MPPKSPKYSLESVKNAAIKGNLVFRSRTERDANNLGYFEEHVIEVFKSLKIQDFHKTEDYSHQEKKVECDVYLPTVKDPDGHADPLYIKFQFTGWIVIHSFHRQR